MIVRIIAWLLSKQSLSPQDRLLLTTEVINSLEAIPLRAILSTDGSHRILIQGKPLSVEQSLELNESAVALERNSLRKTIRDQVRFMAIENGYLRNVEADPYRELFYKAALWYAQEESALIEGLAGTSDLAR